MKQCSLIDLELGSVGLCEGRKTRETGEKPLEQGREPTTNSTHIWRRVRGTNPSHIGGRRALSPLRHPCSPTFFCFVFSFLYLFIHLHVKLSISVSRLCHAKHRHHLELNVVSINQSLLVLSIPINPFTAKDVYRRPIGSCTLYHLWRHQFKCRQIFFISR